MEMRLTPYYLVLNGAEIVNERLFVLGHVDWIPDHPSTLFTFRCLALPICDKLADTLLHTLPAFSGFTMVHTVLVKINSLPKKV